MTDSPRRIIASVHASTVASVGGLSTARSTSAARCASPAAQQVRRARWSTSASIEGVPGSTSCPSPSSARAVASTALRHSGATGARDQASAVQAIRSRPGSAPTSSAYRRSGGGMTYFSPGAGPWRASRAAAVSRSVRQRTKSCAIPWRPSHNAGPTGTRRRVGFSPTIPQSDAGIRIEPPPSVP